MSSQPTTPPGAAGTSWQDSVKRALQRAAAVIRKHPVAFVAVMGTAIFLIAFLGHVTGGNATLKVQMQHSFRSAQVAIYVDGALVCSEHITGSERRRFGLIPNGVGGSFSRLVQVESGSHTVKARVTSDGGYDNTGSISGDFPPGSEVSLQVVPRRSGDLGMNWQGTSAMAAEETPAWYSKYASSLLMTAVGSLVSALMAYFVKELPNLLRRASEPKA